MTTVGVGIVTPFLCPKSQTLTLTFHVGVNSDGLITLQTSSYCSNVPDKSVTMPIIESEVVVRGIYALSNNQERRVTAIENGKVRYEIRVDAKS
jgi:hypothetical protein